MKRIPEAFDLLWNETLISIYMTGESNGCDAIVYWSKLFDYETKNYIQ